MKEKRVVLGFVLGFVLMMSIIGVNAGFWGTITGKATNQPADVTVTVQDEPPVIVQVNAPSSLDLTADTSTNIPFTFVVYDPNGVADLNDATAVGNYDNPSNTPNAYVTTRVGVCIVNSGDDSIDGTAYGYAGEFVRRYSCSVSMEYYDDPAANSWTIQTSIDDWGLNNDVDNSVTFAPNELTGFKTVTSSLGWPALSSASAGVPASNSMTILNTGNAYYDGLSDSYRMKITGYNLYGVTTPAEFISASNFEINTDNPAGDCTTGLVAEKIALVHTTQVIKDTIDLKNGDNTVGGAAEDTLYFCLIQLDNGLSAQDYSTSVQATPWVVSM